MIKRTFISKTNSIFEDRDENFGLYPVCMLNYGVAVSRVLVYFDTDTLQKMYDGGCFPIKGSLTHRLHMDNYGRVSDNRFGEIVNGDSKRATSFDLIFFRIPKPWDRGVGFDKEETLWMTGDSAVSYESSTWNRAKNGVKWDDGGIYTNDKLAQEYEKFKSGEESVIVAEQHFDYGNESIDVDLTDYVNGVLDGKYTNNGLCIAFSPYLESEEKDVTQYVGFYGDKTNTFLKPYVTTSYKETIVDNREFFPLNRDNRLYLYVKKDGGYVDLDGTPKCKIGDKYYDVTKQFKGVYYANVRLSSKDYAKDTILVDEWEGMKLDGESLDNVEMEFVTLPSELSFSASNKAVQPRKISAAVSGANDYVKLVQGQNLTLSVDFRIPYEKTVVKNPVNASYRIYVIDGANERTVIDWDGVNAAYKYNYFNIDTSDLLPHEYHVDLKSDFNGETVVFKNRLTFSVVGDTLPETR